MAFLAPLGAAFAAAAPTVAAVAGTAAAVKSMTDKPKAPSIAAPPVAPTPQASLLKAQEQANQRRKVSLLSGGQTNLTRGTATLKPEDIGKPTLGA